jgi:hypothetical protein
LLSYRTFIKKLKSFFFSTKKNSCFTAFDNNKVEAKGNEMAGLTVLGSGCFSCVIQHFRNLIRHFVQAAQNVREYKTKA